LSKKIDTLREKARLGECNYSVLTLEQDELEEKVEKDTKKLETRIGLITTRPT